MIDNHLKQLSRFSHRMSGTVENRLAVAQIRETLQSFGLKTSIDRFRVPGLLAWGIALNVLLPAAIFFLPIKPRGLSLVLFGAALASLWGELTFSYHAARRILPSHESWNIEAVVDEKRDAKKTIVVTAHHDSPKTGWFSDNRFAARIASGLRKIPPPLNRIYFPPFFAVCCLGTALVLRFFPQARQAYVPLSAFSVGLTAVILVLTIQWALSRPSPGANDNGSGVLVLLELAERFSKYPPANVSVRLVATGAEETGFFGIKEYLRKRRELENPGTLFINLDGVGGGELHWATGEATLQNIPYPRQGLDALAEIESLCGLPVIPKTRINAPTDAGVAAKKGRSVLTLIGLNDKSIPPNFHKMSDTFDRLDAGTLKRAADLMEILVRNYQ